MFREMWPIRYLLESLEAALGEPRRHARVHVLRSKLIEPSAETSELDNGLDVTGRRRWRYKEAFLRQVCTLIDVYQLIWIDGNTFEDFVQQLVGESKSASVFRHLVVHFWWPGFRDRDRVIQGVWVAEHPPWSAEQCHMMVGGQSCGGPYLEMDSPAWYEKRQRLHYARKL